MPKLWSSAEDKSGRAIRQMFLLRNGRAERASRMKKANASAKKLAAKLGKYKNDMHELDRLKERFLSAGVRVKELERETKSETKFMHECPFVVPIIIMSLVIIGLFWHK